MARAQGEVGRGEPYEQREEGFQPEYRYEEYEERPRESHHWSEQFSEQSQSPPGRYEDDDSDESDPKQIEAEIRRTRAEMDETIDALSDRLRPRHLINELLGMFKSKGSKSKSEHHDGDGMGAKAGHMAKNIGGKVLTGIRRHPVPAVLITTALTSLIFESRESSRRKRQRSVFINRGPVYYGPGTGPHSAMHAGQSMEPDEYEYEYGIGGGSAQGYQQHEQGGHRGGEQGMMGMGRAGEKAREMRGRAGERLSEAGEKAREIGSKASERLSEAGESVRHGAERAREGIRETAHKVREGVAHTGERVRQGASSMSEGMKHGYEQVRHGIEQGREFVEQRPITVGLAAVAVGLLAGLLIPRTRREDRLMGEQSDEVMRRGKEMGSEMLHRTKEAASEVVGAATEEAKHQGESLKHEAQSKAQDIGGGGAQQRESRH